MSGQLSELEGLMPRQPTQANPTPVDNVVSPPLTRRTSEQRQTAREAADNIGAAQQKRLEEQRAKITANARRVLPGSQSLSPEGDFLTAAVGPGIDPFSYQQMQPVQDGVFPPSDSTGGISTSNENVSALILNSIQSNPLDQYVNYTYHIKFWITNEINAESVLKTGQTDINNIPKIIIAESGVTAGFNIKEFTYRNLTGTTNITRNMPSVDWKMTITEPLGFSLPDRINSAAKIYGINHWHRAKYFVEVWFTGYKEDGTPHSGLYHKLYRVTISNMNLGGTESGATYEISGIFDGQHGFLNNIAMSDRSIHVGANTVGEFFDKLAQELNTNAVRLALGTAPLTKYEFILPGYMKPWNINPGKILPNDQYASNMTPKKDGNLVVLTISSGTDIGQMVYYVLSLANEAEAWMLGTDTPNNTVAQSIRKNVKLHCKMEYVGFDTKAGDYVKKITYALVPYEEVRVRDDIPSVRAAEKATAQIEKIKYLLQKGRIAKKYEWIYSGANLDIIRFDFKVNNFWSIAVPAYNGFNTTSNSVQGAVTAENSASWALHDRRYRTTVVKAKALQDRKAALQSRITNPLVPEELRRNTTGRGEAAYNARNALQADLANAKAELAFVEQQIAENQAEQDRALMRVRQDFFVDFANPVESAVGDNRLVRQILESNKIFSQTYQQTGAIFAEDQKILDVDTSLPFILPVLPSKEANSATTNQAAASAKPTDTSNNPANIPTNRTLFGAVTGNFDSINKEMINITLDIRGDPYWMGHGNVEQNSVVPDKLNTLSREYVELLGGDNIFWLKFRSGQIPNEETGFMEFTSDNQVVDGFYSVVEVTNTFRDGQFLQTLKSFKDTQSQHANPLMKSIEARKSVTSPGLPPQKVNTVIPQSFPGISGTVTPDGAAFGPGWL